ncbi:MAG: RNA-binding S4 domain-containing protein [Chthonomonadales bacterium]|nr:RNA-binding S4 domain-containing protein [Chthonomonadales bacterium]
MRPATFAVRGDHVTLGQLLKLVGVIDAGGGARAFLAEGGVRVNGEPEARRGRKLRPGDLVSVPGMVLVRLVAEHGTPGR